MKTLFSVFVLTLTLASNIAFAADDSKEITALKQSIQTSISGLVDELKSGKYSELVIELVPRSDQDLKALSMVTPYATLYEVTAHWQMGPGPSADFVGLGNSKETALADARQQCIMQYASLGSENCKKNPTKETYVCFRAGTRDCGDCWTGWTEMGEAVGSCCPDACSRGREIGQDYRTVGVLPPRVQTKHKFLCNTRGEPCN